MSKIEVILPDNSKISLEEGPNGNVNGFDLAKSISEGLLKNAVALEINGEVKDIRTSLSNNDKVRILTSKDPETLAILRHSTSHIMAQAVIALFPQAKLAIGPAIENGFYYDFDLEGHTFTEEDLSKIEEKMKEIVKENLTFEKYFVPDVDAQINEFKNEGEIYKAELLEEHREHKPTLYLTKDKDGKSLFNDLCAGPHLPNTSFIKAFKLMKVAGAYWRGNAKNKMLQRIYATAFWTKEDLKNYLTMLEEAEKRDHRKLGAKLDLFSTREELGAGLVLWHPNLAVVREEIENYWRTEHRKRGYVIVNTPHIAKSKLWEISGHADHYRENMFFIQKEDESDDQYILKPMNCPFHILIYQANRHSYRSLPLRMAELGTVYRREHSGALGGLTRVQGFTQDDAHIFCTPEQLTNEINEIIDFVADTMAIFKMEFEVELSTRPESYIGEIENWNKAEESLKEAMDRRGMKYDINEGDGAFYGPKIDFKFKDAIGRTWQCATIQLDFNLPARFDLKYQDKDGQLKTPLMLHRVVFGSMERFHGILIEHYAGAFPLWLAPAQVAVVPISNDKHDEYAQKVYNALRAQGIRANLDDRSESMNYKIREALQDKKVPYVVVVGDKEIEDGTVSIRKRGKGPIGSLKVDEFVSGLLEEIKKQSIAIMLVKEFKKPLSGETVLIGPDVKDDIIIMALESSCDETACAIVKNGRDVLANVVASQIKTHQQYGGVVPEVAAREHLDAVNLIIAQAFEQSGLGPDDITAFAATVGPGLVGSLLVGLNAAKALAVTYDKPFIGVNHLNAHVCANYIDTELKPPMIALLISGGHTQIIKVEDYLNQEIIGETIDDATGEAYDKVARLLGLPYPGGLNLDRMAPNGNPNAYKLPEAKVQGEFDFSFSGLKTAVLNLTRKLEKELGYIPKEDVAASFQECITSTLFKKTLKAAQKYGIKQIVLGGGVAANSEIRKKFFSLQDEGYSIYAPAMKYCTDNASMIASSAYFLANTMDSLEQEVFSRC